MNFEENFLKINEKKINFKKFISTNGDQEKNILILH
jgi:hypothetical protein